jgi:hypothetical protein
MNVKCLFNVNLNFFTIDCKKIYRLIFHNFGKFNNINFYKLLYFFYQLSQMFFDFLTFFLIFFQCFLILIESVKIYIFLH